MKQVERRPQRPRRLQRRRRVGRALVRRDVGEERAAEERLRARLRALRPRAHHLRRLRLRPERQRRRTDSWSRRSCCSRSIRDYLTCSNPLGGFTIATDNALKSQHIGAGKAYTYPLSVLGNFGYSGRVSLEASVMPADPGVTVAFQNGVADLTTVDEAECLAHGHRRADGLAEVEGHRSPRPRRGGQDQRVVPQPAGEDDRRVCRSRVACAATSHRRRTSRSSSTRRAR